MKRLVSCLFVPVSMMIATTAFAQMGNTGGGGGGMSGQTPTTTSPSPASSSPATTSPSTGNEGNFGSQSQGANLNALQSFQDRQQQKTQDSIRRAERKAKKEAKKAQKDAEKQQKQAEKADTSGTHAAILPEAGYLREEVEA